MLLPCSTVPPCACSAALLPWAGARLSLEGHWFASPPGADLAVSLESSSMAGALLGPSCASVALEAGLGVGGGLLPCSATASDSRLCPSSLAALIAKFSSLVCRWGCTFGAAGRGPL